MVAMDAKHRRGGWSCRHPQELCSAHGASGDSEAKQGVTRSHQQ
jgi:hypothetical protein